MLRQGIRWSLINLAEEKGELTALRKARLWKEVLDEIGETATAYELGASLTRATREVNKVVEDLKGTSKCRSTDKRINDALFRIRAQKGE